MASPRIGIVRGAGGNSLDSYACELVSRLRLPVFAAPGSTGAFGHRLVSREALARARADLAVVRALRRAPVRAVHLTSHHLARYGPLLGMPYVVTVHDLFRLRDWSDRASAAPLIHRPNLRDGLLLSADAAGIRRAAALIAVSRHTARDVLDTLGVDPVRLHVVPEGVDTTRFRPAAPPPGAGRYVLFVGSEQPRKNLPTLLRALADLVRHPLHADLRLVKVGAPGGPEAPYRRRFVDQVHAAGLAGRLVLPGRVGHEELLSWYSGAECLVLPSVAEGFGLPVLEAMACGCPVVVPEDSAQAEAGGAAAARYSPASDGDALATAIRRVLENPRYGDELRRRGFDRARELSWERSIERTRWVYETVLEPAAAPAGALWLGRPAATSQGAGNRPS